MNWKDELTQALAENGETWADVEANTMSEEDMAREFCDIKHESCPFTVWTKLHVYFPARYDSHEWAEFISRHPDGKPTEHVGGG